MGENVKNTFKIKDLENFSKIKISTLRMWEKRYQIFTPERTKTNIRKYSIQDLKKLLNIVFLIENGLKIGEISKLSESELNEKVLELFNESNQNTYYSKQLLLAGLHFDTALFDTIYKEMLDKHSFEYVFNQVIIPMFQQIGLLWQTEMFEYVHEHFISNIITGKLWGEIQKLNDNSVEGSDSYQYVLFLPEEEIHDIGLLFLYYRLLKRGKKVIYLGQKNELEKVERLNNTFVKITYIIYSSVYPTFENVEKYYSKAYSVLNNNNKNRVWMIHPLSNELPSNNEDLMCNSNQLIRNKLDD